MNLMGLRLLLILLSLLALVAGVTGMFIPLAGTRPAPSIQRPGLGKAIPTGNMDSLVQRAVEHAPFRAARMLAAVAYDPARLIDMGSAVPTAPPRPTLSLSGIVWSTEPTAVIDGFPGVGGPRVVRQGDVVSDLKVKRIERSRVIVVGLDTTWHLTVRTSWQ